MTTRELTRMPFGYSIQVEDLPFDAQAFVDQGLFGQLRAGIKAYVYGENLKTKKIRYPKDWWQMLKAQHAPGWFTKRYPVKYTTINVYEKVLYPEFKPAMKPHVFRIDISPDLSWKEGDEEWQPYDEDWSRRYS